jgi:beta-glucosidase
MAFPKEFLWGAATASAQIEGGWNEDGRTPSIWDVTPNGKIKGDANCHVACDHYHRWQHDVALMKELGLKSYRFSISWSRVMPDEGRINQKGIAFYSELVDELRRNDIEPIVTIYHWDLPIWAQEKGGWMSNSIISFFADYTKVVVDALSDRVTYWLPMNEPQCFIMNGHMVGAHAPFLKHYLTLPKLTRNCLSAFHLSVEIINTMAKTPPKIGIAMAASAFIPKNESTEEIADARHKSFYYKAGVMSNRWWSDPLLLGKVVRAYGIYSLRKADIPHILTKLDFIGLNVYSPFGENWNGTNDEVPSEKKNSLGWVNDGRCLYWAIRFFNERYSLPVMVTENGLCDNDEIVADNHVRDEKRSDYIREYIGNVKRAVDEGIPVLGYQYWSLMDNFEWAEGYSPRFGIIHVDFDTQKRTLKDSAYAYKRIIDTNGACL